MDSKETKVLIKARKLLSDPEKWTRERFSASKDGKVVLPRSRLATCWCILGSLVKVDGFDTPSADEYLIQALPEGFDSLVGFNDHPFTTHADVMALFDRAIEASRKENENA